MKAYTEVQDYIRRMTALNPEKDITMLDRNNRVEIYSIGDDGTLYLTYEDDGNSAKYSRVSLLAPCKEFAATLIKTTGAVAIASADEENVVLAITNEPEKLSKDQFKRINLAGVLGGKKLVPSNLLITALDSGITLFIEMKDETGRIEQFACVLDSKNPDAVKYFPLASNFSSVDCSIAGRAVSQYVDGIYTYGAYGDTKQLLYTPSYNVFGTSQPAPIRLKADYQVDTIGTLVLTKKTGTHLFAVGEQGLYFYPYDKQKDMYHINEPDPVLVATSEYFTEAKKVQAVLFGKQLYVYVLNESNVLSYTFADYVNDQPSNFKEPVRMMENVYYFDVSGAGTMNICTADKAIFGTRSMETGEWGFEDACIESNLEEYHKESAYVSRINTEVPFAEVEIEIQGSKKACCYVNDIYHNFKTLTVKADASGCIKVAQTAVDLTPPCFSVHYEDETIEINPGLESQQQVLTLTDVNMLKAQIITDPVGNESKLFEGEDENSLQIIASGISSMNGAINSFLPGFCNSPINQFVNGVYIKITEKIISILPYEVTHNPFVDFIADVVKDVEYAVNWMVDKVKWLYDHTIKQAVEFVIGAVGKVWKFMVKVGEKVLEVVVDTIEQAFSAIKKLLEFIGIPVDKIFDWLKKLLGIDDVVKMNDSMKHMIRLMTKKMSEKALELKEDAIGILDTAIDSIEKWANIDAMEAKKVAGDYATQTPSQYGIELTPRNMYMFDTIYSGFVMDDIVFPELSITSKMQEAADVLEQAFQGMRNDLSDAVEVIASISENMSEIFGSKDIFVICENLKQILGKVAISGLDVCKAFIRPLFDFVAYAIEAIMDALCTPIHIPFLSEILKIFGISEFSIVDLFTFPVSFFTTVVTKVATGKPLLDESMYQSIMNASSIDSIGKVANKFLRSSKKAPILQRQLNEVQCTSGMLKADTKEEPQYLFDESLSGWGVFCKATISAFGYLETLTSIAFMGLAAVDSEGEGIRVTDKVEGVFGLIYSVVDFVCSYCVGYHVYSPMDTDNDTNYSKSLKTVRGFTEAYTICWWIKGIVSIFDGCITTYSLFRGEKKGEFAEKAATVFGCVLNVAALVCELGGAIATVDAEKTKEYVDEDRDKEAYLCDTIAYIVDDVRGILDAAYSLGVNKVKEPHFIMAYIGIRSWFAIAYAGCMTGAATILKEKVEIEKK